MSEHRTPNRSNHTQKNIHSLKNSLKIHYSNRTRSRLSSVIRSFMTKTASKREAHFLNTVCSDSGVCLAFGKEKEKLQRFFDFTSFAYAKPVVTRIGKPSVNGFVREVEYEREGYQAHAILKSSIEMNSDSLTYEYLVGTVLNRVNRWLPSFVESYGLFYYIKDEDRKQVIKGPAILSLYESTDAKKRAEHVAKVTPLNPANVSTVCRTSHKQCLLIQHMKDSPTLGDRLPNKMFFMYDLLYVLYPLYFSLKCLRKTFTHYDFHQDNVLLYEPIKGGYIEYHIHTNDGEVVFCSKYIAKIIDYGSSFIQGSMGYYDMLCAERVYCHDCGTDKGFQHLSKDRKQDSEYFFINSLYKNESHDLRLLNECVIESPISSSKIPHVQAFINVLKSTTYGIGIRDPSERRFGTVEDLSTTDKINNVSSAEKQLRTLVQSSLWKFINQHEYKSLRKIGELHIYEDKTTMRYIEEPVRSFHV